MEYPEPQQFHRLNELQIHIVLKIFKIMKITQDEASTLQAVLEHVLDRALLGFCTVFNYLKTERRLQIPERLQGDWDIYLRDC